MIRVIFWVIVVIVGGCSRDDAIERKVDGGSLVWLIRGRMKGSRRWTRRSRCEMSRW